MNFYFNYFTFVGREQIHCGLWTVDICILLSLRSSVKKFFSSLSLAERVQTSLTLARSCVG